MSYREDIGDETRRIPIVRPERGQRKRQEATEGKRQRGRDRGKRQRERDRRNTMGKTRKDKERQEIKRENEKF